MITLESIELSFFTYFLYLYTFILVKSRKGVLTLALWRSGLGFFSIASHKLMK